MLDKLILILQISGLVLAIMIVWSIILDLYRQNKLKKIINAVMIEKVLNEGENKNEKSNNS